jgi:hypothetical protein
MPDDAGIEGGVPSPVSLDGQSATPFVQEPPAEGPVVGATPNGEPMIQGGETIEQEPVIQPVPSSGARFSPRARPLR